MRQKEAYDFIFLNFSKTRRGCRGKKSMQKKLDRFMNASTEVRNNWRQKAKKEKEKNLNLRWKWIKIYSFQICPTRNFR